MHAVLVLDHAYVNGGQAKVAIQSALGLRARGHRVTLFAAVGPIDPALPAAGVEVVCLGQDDIKTTRSPLVFAAQAIWNTRAAAALGEHLAGLDPRDTVVHVHGWAQSLSPAIGPAIARSRLPAAYTMHEFFLVCPNGGFYDYPAEAICHRTPMSMACVTRNCDARSYPRKVARVIRHAGLEHVSRMRETIRHVVLISELQREVAARYFPATTRFHRIDNPIAVENPGPKPEGPLGPTVFVGRLSREKGVHVLAEAARIAGVPLRLVGDGPAVAEIRAGYPEAEMLGWRDAAGVREAMRGARALAFPSVWYEGQPLTVLESLALGTPVLVSDACAGREAVADGETGLWFRSGDPESLAGALRRLADDGTARAMGEAARRRYWAAPLTLERHVDRIVDLYSQIIAEVIATSARRVPSSRAATAVARA